MTPSINRMIKLLSQSEQHSVTKQLVIQMESEILKALQFDLNFLCPLHFLERFLRLSRLHDDYKITTIAEELCKQSLTKMEFLNFKPSVVAAAALTIAINLATSPSDEVLKADI